MPRTGCSLLTGNRLGLIVEEESWKALLGGCLVSAVVGVLGAYLGYWLATQLGLPELIVVNVDGEPFPIIWSIIGSAIFAVIVGLLTRRRVYP